MNEYCKGCLKHSWGTSPERKKLEQEYNRNYYSANKNRWVINRQRRLGALTSNTDRNKSGKGVVTPFDFYKPGEFNDSAKKGFKKIKEVIDATAVVPLTVISTALIVADAVAAVPKAAIDAGKKFVKSFKDLSIVKFIKEANAAYDKAVSDAKSKKYDSPIGPTRKKK